MRSDTTDSAADKSLGIAAGDVGYSPSVIADWGSSDPGSVKEALDYAAAHFPGGGGIGGSTGATDNAILRADGIGGATLQNSLVVVNDSGDITLPDGRVVYLRGTSIGIYSASAGNMTLVAQGTLTYLGDAQQFKNQAAGSIILDLLHVASAANRIKITNAVTGAAALITATGDANAAMSISGSGTGVVDIVKLTATSPVFVTPTLGAATATTINKVTITAPASAATLTLTDGTTLTGPAASGTAMTLGNAETVTGAKTWTGIQTFNNAKFSLAGSTSGNVLLEPIAIAGTNTVMTLPNTTSAATIAALEVAQTWTAAQTLGTTTKIQLRDSGQFIQSDVANGIKIQVPDGGTLVLGPSTAGNISLGDGSTSIVLYPLLDNSMDEGDSTHRKKDVYQAGLQKHYNALVLVGNGLPSEIATIDSTGLTGNVAAATLYAVPSTGAGWYRVNVMLVTTTAASVSSTMPNAQVVYTDKDSNTSVTLDVSPILGAAGLGQSGTLAANAVGTVFSGVVVIYVKASTTIQYKTVNYASTIAGMAYALRIRLESL